jgi:hypothetical protein
MSQVVGFQYKSRIPQFSDDASIQEALRVYHYGVDNYTTEPIPNDSIEGNFRSINDRVAIVESSVVGLTTTYLEQVSLTASPNVVTSQSIATIPVTVRAIVSQTAPLQQWQNSSSVSVGSVGVGGNANLAGYITVGSTTQSTTTGVNVVVGNASHIGVVVKSQVSQTANIQEWQNSSGIALSYVTPTGVIFSNQLETVNLADIQTLLNKTLVTPVSNISRNVQAASYTLVLGDKSKMIEMSGGGNLTVPSGVFSDGDIVSILQTGASQVTIVPSGTTVNATPGLKIRSQWSMATLICRGSNVFVLSGDVVS